MIKEEWRRNTGLLAATFLILDDLAPNHVICGIGAWWDPLARNEGIEHRKPLTAMRATIGVLRRLLNMERVIPKGEMTAAMVTQRGTASRTWWSTSTNAIKLSVQSFNDVVYRLGITSLFREHLPGDIRPADVVIDSLIRNIKLFTFKGGFQ